MVGRQEHKREAELSMVKRLEDAPEYMNRFNLFLGKKSHTTKKTYINHVIRFLKYVGNDEYPALETITNLNDYIVQLYMSQIGYYEINGELRELKENSQNSAYSSLSSFFKFIQKTYGMEKNPFSDGLIERPTIPEKPVTYLTPNEIKMLENQVLNGVGTEKSIARQAKWKYRDLLLFRIPLVNGLRLTALSEINIDDIDFNNDTIIVTEKRNITKYVNFDTKTANYLRIWLRDRDILLGSKAKQEKSLFISNQRKRMTQRAIEKIIEKYSICINGKHVTPHMLRRSFGTNLYQETKDIYLVADLLGHKTTEPTTRYVKVLEDNRTAAIKVIGDLY